MKWTAAKQTGAETKLQLLKTDTVLENKSTTSPSSKRSRDAILLISLIYYIKNWCLKWTTASRLDKSLVMDRPRFLLIYVLKPCDILFFRVQICVFCLTFGLLSHLDGRGERRKTRRTRSESLSDRRTPSFLQMRYTCPKTEFMYFWCQDVIFSVFLFFMSAACRRWARSERCLRHSYRWFLDFFFSLSL